MPGEKLSPSRYPPPPPAHRSPLPNPKKYAYKIQLVKPSYFATILICLFIVFVHHFMTLHHSSASQTWLAAGKDSHQVDRHKNKSITQTMEKNSDQQGQEETLLFEGLKQSFYVWCTSKKCKAAIRCALNTKSTCMLLASMRFYILIRTLHA